MYRTYRRNKIVSLSPYCKEELRKQSETFECNLCERMCYSPGLVDMVLSDQEQSSQMCTPRNLALLTLSTATLMLHELTFPEIYHNLFSPFYIQEVFVVFVKTPMPYSCNWFHHC